MIETQNKFSVKAVLEKFFGTQVQDRTIKQLKRSAWQGDENTMGVDSYPKVGEWKRKKNSSLILQIPYFA